MHDKANSTVTRLCVLLLLKVNSNLCEKIKIYQNNEFYTSTGYFVLFFLVFQISSASEHTSNIALLRSIFVENLDLLVVASEDNNICKYTLLAVFTTCPLTCSGFVITIVKPNLFNRNK